MFLKVILVLACLRTIYGYTIGNPSYWEANQDFNNYYSPINYLNRFPYWGGSRRTPCSNERAFFTDENWDLYFPNYYEYNIDTGRRAFSDIADSYIPNPTETNRNHFDSYPSTFSAGHRDKKLKKSISRKFDSIDNSDLVEFRHLINTSCQPGYKKKADGICRAAFG